MCLRICICPSLFDGSHPSSLLAPGITLKVLLSLLVNEQFVNRLSLFYLSCYDRSIRLPDTSAYPDVLVSKPIFFFYIKLKLMIIKCHKVWEHIKTGTSLGSGMKKCKRVRRQQAWGHLWRELWSLGWKCSSSVSSWSLSALCWAFSFLCSSVTAK